MARISIRPSSQQLSMHKQTITPFLWFDKNAEEAVKYYASVFIDSKIGSISRYSDESAKASGMPKGAVMTVEFQLNGQDFIALNGGPVYKFSPATSFMVTVETQLEVDHLWDELSKGGTPNVCGWLTDKFGVTWQIVPKALNELLQDKDPVKAKRVMEAMLKMKNIEIAGLRKAYEGK